MNNVNDKIKEIYERFRNKAKENSKGNFQEYLLDISAPVFLQSSEFKEIVKLLNQTEKSGITEDFAIF